MSIKYSIYFTVYLEQEVSNYNCYVNETEWTRITNANPTTRLFARISNNEKEWYVALGQPVQTNLENNKTLFVPNWMLEQISVVGDGTSFNVEWIPVDFFENSTHIRLKMVDFDYDANDEELSVEFTKLGILQRGTKIHINMPSLDNQTIIYEVFDVEPANVVLCQGDEVSLEFVKDIPKNTIARPPSPYPFLPELLFPPSAPEAEPTNNILGGTKREERYNPWRSKDFKPPFS